ncbi:family 43 glycosylhydrolase [Trichocoleus sp. FACHB-90]|uniref:family 43 glycosylhydrolase n=1 Tax=Cyanophyceae TaxID=3028117 RepID=UPI0016854108|nr:family 43 glycosylhydrolase [Trichocoleus sp. FACHB-90]MBD1926116.1 family 43 glycosylhydrolase [Trichocoleus sp. FACHB-90]
MKLNPLHKKILSGIEPLPLRNSIVSSTNLTERGLIRIGETVTGILRYFRPGEPMNWDPWILKDDDVYRMFYLRGLEGQNPWWTVSNICSAISTDLQQWQDLGTILEPEPANGWESGRICAGCTYKEDDIYYLFYSAGGKEGEHQKNEAIGLATSRDGLHFKRYSNNYLVKPDERDPWYGRSNWTKHYHWRDPYIFKDDKTGNYYMFICASSQVAGDFQGCIGLAVADKIYGSYKLLPPVVEAPMDAVDWPYYHMERPQVIYKNGKYNLFFSCFKMLMNPKWVQKVKRMKITSSSLYWYISDEITGPYKPVNNDNFVVRGSEKTGIYGTNFLQTSTNPDEYIAYGWYHRLHALEVQGAFRVLWQDISDSQNQNAPVLPSYSDTLSICLSRAFSGLSYKN